jgi:hypothetical protein
MNWVSANDLECEAPPTTYQSGVIEYPDEERTRSRRTSKRFKLPETLLTNLYLNEGLSPNRISRDSLQYFGRECSATHVIRELKRYGVPIRTCKKRMWPSQAEMVTY